MPRLKKMNQNVYEAALDLGATPFQALRKVIMPEIWPGMISGFILAFTLSIADFAVSTILFVTVLVLLIVINKRADKAAK